MCKATFKKLILSVYIYVDKSEKRVEDKEQWILRCKKVRTTVTTSNKQKHPHMLLHMVSIDFVAFFRLSNSILPQFCQIKLTMKLVNYLREYNFFFLNSSIVVISLFSVLYVV